MTWKKKVKVKKLFKYLLELLKTNVVKTIWFNYKMLPWRQAVKLPLFLYGKIAFRNTNGSLVINAGVYPGMIKIGKQDRYVMTSKPFSIWTIEGSISFHSGFVFYGGSYVFCAKNAELSFMGGGFCGSNTKIICFDRITLNDTRVTWNCQIMDTSYHYLEMLDDPGQIKSLTAPVCLGNHVWIGNNTTIAKGAVVPDETIIASHSLVNKDFSAIGSFCLLAGVPAEVKRTKVRRVYEIDKEAEMDKKFGYSRTHL